jgi:hypothetical protein
LLYGSESWTIRARDINKIQPVERGYLRTVQGCTRVIILRSWIFGEKWINTDKIGINDLDRTTGGKLHKQIIKHKPKER